MRKPYIKHENLRKIINQFNSKAMDKDSFEKFRLELNHSCLISAISYENEDISLTCVENNDCNFGLLFTDMDEFRKTFPDFNKQSQENDFIFYKMLYQCFDLDGFILNPDGESIILDERFFKENDDFPQNQFSLDNAYTSIELKNIKNSINNNDLEEFINNPNNIGKYEELFGKMASSTLLTLMLSKDNLSDLADEGVISMKEKGPLGFLYIDEIGGDYATVYTSESKMNNVQTSLNKYSQIVNFSYMVNFILNDDMDGIIINPGEENIVLTRDVLLEFSSHLEKTCNDSRLSTAIFHMFLLEDEVYV